VVSGLFYLGTILCYLRAAASVGGNSWRWCWFSAALILFALSLLSQPVGITLPFVLLVLDIYPLRRLGGDPGKWFEPAARRVWWEKVPFLMLAAGAGAIGLVAKQQYTQLLPTTQYGPIFRAAVTLYGLVFYLRKTILPVGLSPHYPLPMAFNPWAWDWPFLLSAAVVLLVSIGLFALRHRWPAGLATWICYMIILAPLLGIVQIAPQLVADRYSYLSCLGWAILAGAGILYLWQRWLNGRVGQQTLVASVGLAGSFLVGLGVLTWQQTQVWHDSERLWRHALVVGQESIYAHDNLGTVLFERGELEAAIEHFRQAVQIDPAYAKAHYNLGIALARRGELGESIMHLREAVQIDPAYAKAHYNLGVALARRGELEAAIDHFRKTVLIEPQSAEAHESLGRALAQQGRKDEAAQHYQEALRILKSRRSVPAPSP